MTADESRVDPAQESSRPDDRHPSPTAGRDLRPTGRPGSSADLLRPAWENDTKPRPSPDSESAAEEGRPASHEYAGRKNGVRRTSLGGFSHDGIAYIGPGRWGGEPLPRRAAPPGARGPGTTEPGPDRSDFARQRTTPRARAPSTSISSEGSRYPTERELDGAIRTAGSLVGSTAVGPSPGTPTRSTDLRAGPQYVPRYYRGNDATSPRLSEASTARLGPYDALTPALPGPVHSPRSIFGKWSPEILAKLNAVPSLRFETLRRELRGISPRMLSLKLRALADQKLVERRVVDARPPKVQYSITARGRTIVGLVDPVLSYLSDVGPATSADATLGGATQRREVVAPRATASRPVRRKAVD
jgi:DNA-binding HxlR family transcriptional regulator